LLLVLRSNSNNGNEAIEFVKNYNDGLFTIEETLMSAVESNEDIYEIHGWEVKHVETDIYFVAFSFDTDDIRSNGYSFYCYEANLDLRTVRKIWINDTLLTKYRDLGYIN